MNNWPSFDWLFKPTLIGAATLFCGGLAGAGVQVPVWATATKAEAPRTNPPARVIKDRMFFFMMMRLLLIILMLLALV
jgi:hypothetical protein